MKHVFGNGIILLACRCILRQTADVLESGSTCSEVFIRQRKILLMKSIGLDGGMSGELIAESPNTRRVRMLEQGQCTAAEQITTGKTEGWDAPYHWAPFLLQGEWR